MNSPPPEPEPGQPAAPRKNRRAPAYWPLYRALPDEIKPEARAAFRQFLADPRHPSLRLHELKDTKRGRHRSGSFSVSITMKYRAIFAVDGDTNVWYWIGTHNDYNVFVGKK